MCHSNLTHYSGWGLQFFIVPDAALITKSHPLVSKPHLAIYFEWGWRKKKNKPCQMKR